MVPNGTSNGAASGPVVTPVSIQVPFTTGGSGLRIERAADFATEHFEQRDESHNQALWDLFPVSLSNQKLEAIYSDNKAKARSALQTSPELYMRFALPVAIGYHERARIAANLLTLRKCYALLIAGGHYNPETIEDVKIASQQFLAERKKEGAVEPLSHVLKRLRVAREHANDVYFRFGNHGRAMVGYCRALFDLYPWVSTPLIFKSDDDLTFRVADIEGALWANIARSALQLYNTVFMDTRWLDIARAASEAVMNMRYACPKLLGKAYFRHAVAGKQLALHRSPSSTPVSRAHSPTSASRGLNKSTLGLTRASSLANSQSRSSISSRASSDDLESVKTPSAPLLLPGLEREAAEIELSVVYIATDVGQAWAHDECVTSHVCATRDKMAAVVQEKLDKGEHVVVHLPNGLAVRFDEASETAVVT